MSDSSSDSESKPWRFKPGQSGNPGGKSAEREELRRYCTSAYTKNSIDGIARLAGVTEEKGAKSEKVRLDALIWLAEQGVGKATQAVTGENGAPLLDVPTLVRKVLAVAEENKGDGGESA